jgi:hypothetical protein
VKASFGEVYLAAQKVLELSFSCRRESSR